MESENRIGFTEIGGLYVGKNIKSDFHKTHAITVILSFKNDFSIKFSREEPFQTKAILIQKEVRFKLESENSDSLIIFHLDPYSENGIRLTFSTERFRILDHMHFEVVRDDIESWFNDSENEPKKIKKIIENMSVIISNNNNPEGQIDERVIKAMHFVNNLSGEKISIKDIARLVYISHGRLAHLFKQNIGISFRSYVRHRKLIKSINAMYEKNNLTEASFAGGFSDQSHFTRTFKQAFGIKPSHSKK